MSETLKIKFGSDPGGSRPSDRETLDSTTRTPETMIIVRVDGRGDRGHARDETGRVPVVARRGDDVFRPLVSEISSRAPLSRGAAGGGGGGGGGAVVFSIDSGV